MTDAISAAPGRRQAWLDAGLALTLLFGSFIAIHRLADREPASYHRSTARDIWFDADIDRVYRISTSPKAANNRSWLHPLFTYVALPPATVLRKGLGLSYEEAVRVFYSGIGAIWVASFFLLLRWLTLKRPDSLLLTGVAATSAVGVFWLGQVETFAMGSLSIFPAIALAAAPASVGLGWWVLAGITGLSITITNWLIAFLSSYLRLSRKKFITVSLLTLGIVVGLTYAFSLVLPSSASARTSNEFEWIFLPESGGPLSILRVFFVTSVVAPDISFLENPRHLAWPLMTMQAGPLFSGTRWALIATPAWIGLLCLGAYAFWKTAEFRTLRVVLGVALLYQLWMHLVYGRETFLYALHWLPILLIIAGMATFTRLRPVVLILASVLVVSNTINNVRQYQWALQYSHRYAPLKSVEAETARRLHHKSLGEDPNLRYRFWRDGLGLGKESSK